MSEQFAEAQIERAAKAIREVDARAALIADVDLAEYRARAALVAAQGAAPQAESADCDRDRMGICKRCGMGWDARKVLEGDFACPVLPSSGVDEAETERDAATEAIDRVRAIHRPVEIEPSSTICGECSFKLPNGKFFGKIVEFPCSTLAALDAAPEPEGRWEYRGRLQSCGYVADGYISAEHAMNGLRGELEDHPYLAMDDTAIVERARVREWLPVEGEKP